MDLQFAKQYFLKHKMFQNRKGFHKHCSYFGCPLVNLESSQTGNIQCQKKTSGASKISVICLFTILLSLLVNLQPSQAGNDNRKTSGASKVPFIGCFICSWNFIRYWNFIRNQNFIRNTNGYKGNESFVQFGKQVYF